MPANLIDSYYTRAHVDAQASISCNAFGGTSDSYDYAARDVDIFSHETRDHLLVFAAGNGERDISISTPASAKNVLAVGAVANAAESAQTLAIQVLGPVRQS